MKHFLVLEKFLLHKVISVVIFLSFLVFFAFLLFKFIFFLVGVETILSEIYVFAVGDPGSR